MSKILNTQLNGVFNRIEAQALDVQMAAQCLIQAIGGEGTVYVKGYEDLNFFEDYVLNSNEKLKSSAPLASINTFKDIDTTDRVLLFSPYYTEQLKKDVETLIDCDVDFVLICNKPKTEIFQDHLFHFINLSTPRPIVYTEDYDKIVTPHPIAFSYIYYDIYTQMIEMVRDLDL
ncbi:hypothetical protein BJG89_04510 [Staphylococcus nepalensis]|uniref:DUF2529 family protein n=1 Tax=Staphylococcus TaxID=1279 RepID=UPI000BC34F01|nr:MULTISPECIES: DUF2529 family protein [Staphylococcus]ATH59586.1 hypothetical protein BJD96_04170 [Staphylococcus nepalensis]ATH64677.1 hypothetical protein BJG89_04510 [Staphylococcus nepalensis]AWI44034.1 hypothetical protein BJG88_04240 [Staphylococcus nepalensis]NWN86615.1 DUF2529 domain-containing protein [Staphylococcus sp.]